MEAIIGIHQIFQKVWNDKSKKLKKNYSDEIILTHCECFPITLYSLAPSELNLPIDKFVIFQRKISWIIHHVFLILDSKVLKIYNY